MFSNQHTRNPSDEMSTWNEHTRNPSSQMNMVHLKTIACKWVVGWEKGPMKKALLAQPAGFGETDDERPVVHLFSVCWPPTKVANLERFFEVDFFFAFCLGRIISFCFHAKKSFSIKGPILIWCLKSWWSLCFSAVSWDHGQYLQLWCDNIR